MLVTLNDRNAQKVIFHNAVAITDLTEKISAAFDMSKFREIRLYGISTLNQDVSIAMLIEGTFVRSGTGAFTEPKPTLPIANAGKVHYLGDIFGSIMHTPTTSMSLSVKCITAPTSGSVTIFALGVPN